MASFRQRFLASTCTQRVLSVFIVSVFPVSMCIGKGIEHLQDKTNRVSLSYRDYRRKQLRLAEQVREECLTVKDTIHQIQLAIDASKVNSLINDKQEACEMYWDDMLTIENELVKLRKSNETMNSWYEEITYDNEHDPL